MSADEGPLGTRDYRLVLEAAPLDGGRTFLHLSYAYAYGTIARLANVNPGPEEFDGLPFSPCMYANSSASFFSSRFCSRNTGSGLGSGLGVGGSMLLVAAGAAE